MGPARLTQIALTLSRRGLTIEDALRDGKDPVLEFVRSELQQALKLELIEEELPSGAQVLTPESEYYPRQRLDLRLPLSPILYVSGNAALLSAPGVAISGSRKSSPEALRYVGRLVQLLTSSGLNIVSGHAAGVDEAAHVTALTTGGTTTIVAAEGLGRFNVKKSIPLEDQTSFALLSEFAPSDRWTGFRAMKRNSTIAALADGVVVVAAGLSGGSRAQAELCLRAKKPVLVPDVRTPDAPGNQELIKMGAIPIDPSRPEQVLDYLRDDAGHDETQLKLLDS
jgi:DNA processing protein